MDYNAIIIYLLIANTTFLVSSIILNSLYKTRIRKLINKWGRYYVEAVTNMKMPHQHVMHFPNEEYEARYGTHTVENIKPLPQIVRSQNEMKEKGTVDGK